MPLLGPDMEARNRAFQRLKPVCVDLSQAALALNGPSADITAVTARLNAVKNTLSLLTAKTEVLDQKLADYAFFPISSVLKFSQRIPIRCLELSLECISILIDKGWHRHIQPQLATQVVILCTLMAEKKPKGFAFKETSDELQTAAFLCLQYVFDAAGESLEIKNGLTTESNFPQMGQTISVILDGINDGRSFSVQTSATHALRSLIGKVADRELSAGFLPGIVSKLTKALTASTKQRRSHYVLVGCVEVFAILLQNTMSENSNPYNDMKPQTANIKPSIITEKWQNDAADKLELPIRTVTRLSTHDREDVRASVADMCFIVLQECRKTLKNCAVLVIQTLISLITKQTGNEVEHRLEVLIASDSNISNMLLEIVYDWLQSAPTLMQSSDEQIKIQMFQKISVSYGLLTSCEIDTGTIDRILANTLRDSIVITLQMPAEKPRLSFVAPVQALDIAKLDREPTSSNFNQALAQHNAQAEVIDSIEGLVKLISETSKSSNFTSGLGRSLQLSQGEARLAEFWLMLTSIQADHASKNNEDSFLNIENGDSMLAQERVEEMYSYALSILTEFSDETPDFRIQGVALRVLAFRAQTSGKEFRYELIDALYPILHTLATPNEQLQQDSIVALNIITDACGYSSVRDLIVENVDYLTNAVALKLNAFDVSPQGPQVLLMMVRLAGPSLLPYLEDTVESIFAALEDYHGYAVLVELLFKVLNVIAEEGVKNPQLAITAGADSSVSIFDESAQPMSITALIENVQEQVLDQELEQNQASLKSEVHPERPWKGIEEVDEDETNDGTEPKEEDKVKEVEEPPPAPKVYALLFKITELTQHFLPSASPSLRSSLLALIRKTVPSLSKHENSFLPLVNTIWPEITARLDDEERHVQETALEIVAILCKNAGDFMRSRIVELWPRFVELYNNTVNEMIAETRNANSTTGKKAITAKNATERHGIIKHVVGVMKSSPATYTNTSTRVTWETLVDSMATIVQFVRLPTELFDEALEMMQPALDQRPVSSAFGTRNPDAVWLARLRSGTIPLPKMPLEPPGVIWRFATLHA